MSYRQQSECTGRRRPAIPAAIRKLVLADCAEGTTYPQIVLRRGVSQAGAARIISSTVQGNSDLLMPGQPAALTGYTARGRNSASAMRSLSLLEATTCCG